MDQFGLHPQMDLMEFFQTYVIDNCLSHSEERNIDQYHESLGMWQRATKKVKIADLSQEHVQQFLKAVKKRKNNEGEFIASSTVRKHCVALQYVLDRLGPKSRHNNDEGVGMIAEPPFIKKPTVVTPDEPKWVYTLPEISQWLEGCSFAADRTIAGYRKMPSPTWWRASILVAYTTGMRLEAILALKRSWMYQDDYGWWITVPIAASKTKRSYRCFLNSVGYDAIQRVTDGHKRDLVFPIRCGISWLHELRRNLQEKCLPEQRRFGWHSCRKACGTQLAAINSMASSMQLGHAKGGVTRDHYVDRSKVLSEAVAKMPMPAWQWPDARAKQA